MNGELVRKAISTLLNIPKYQLEVKVKTKHLIVAFYV